MKSKHVDREEFLDHVAQFQCCAVEPTPGIVEFRAKRVGVVGRMLLGDGEPTYQIVPKNVVPLRLVEKT
jgi:hypothetical protein